MPEAVDDRPVLDLTTEEPFVNLARMAARVVGDDHAGHGMRNDEFAGCAVVERKPLKNVVAAHPHVCGCCAEFIDEKRPAVLPGEKRRTVDPASLTALKGPVTEKLSAVHAGACSDAHHGNAETGAELHGRAGLAGARRTRHVDRFTTSEGPPRGERAVVRLVEEVARVQDGDAGAGESRKRFDLVAQAVAFAGEMFAEDGGRDRAGCGSEMGEIDVGSHFVSFEKENEDARPHVPRMCRAPRANALVGLKM